MGFSASAEIIRRFPSKSPLSISTIPRVHIEAIEGRILFAVYSPPVNPRITADFDGGWKFLRADAAGASAPTYNDSSWTGLSLPHTWNIADGQDGGNNYYRGVGWYRKSFTPPGTFAGKRTVIRFGAAGTNASVYLNGALVGEHKGGYAAFAFDVTDKLKLGQANVFAVKVTNAYNADVAPIADDFTVAGGLYRDVQLIAVNGREFNITTAGAPGVYLSTNSISSTSATVGIRADVRNLVSSSSAIRARVSIVDAAGNLVAQNTSAPIDVGAWGAKSIVSTVNVPSPHLWNGTADPYLYTVYAETLDSAGKTTDVTTQPLGIRTVKVDAAKGFLLNGKIYDLHGVTMHQDRIDVGVARTAADRANDIDLVRQVGATALRVSHYQHADDVYAELDRTGIVAWAEVPNVFSYNNTTAFKDYLKQQLKELIRQEYNHPSIAVWGLFNEVYDSPATATFVGELNTLAHAEDATRFTAGASNISPAASINFKTDAIAFNRYNGWYGGNTGDFNEFLKNTLSQYPSRAIGIAEYGAGASVKQHEEDPAAVDPNSRYHPEEYQGKFHEAYWSYLKVQPRLWWKTMWNMFDFASDRRSEGDTLGRNDKGLVTGDRQIKKDAFYFYQANWSSSPVLHVTSGRFTQRTDANTPVKIYSNASSVTLKVNGQIVTTAPTKAGGVFKWSNILLSPGDNDVFATAVINGQTVTDQVTWTLS